MDVQHKQIICGNTKVFFPFDPYETQINYIKSVVEALERKQNALLESPTGTGKTLSLLCSSLAWVQSQSGQTNSVIYYTSRTHMQLSQAAKEMKRTAYRRVPAVVLGSRVQMCLNDEVRSAPSNLINRTCRNATARNACIYYTNYEQKLETMEQNDVHDIEDLANFGKKHQCCPYYISKKIAETKATIVFMPYNYLLDTSVRKSIQLKIDNSVIIFDEAHNIESVLKDSVSGSFTKSSLSVVQDSCDKLPAKVHEALNKEKHGLSRAGYDPKDKPGSIIDEFAKQKPKKQKEKEVKVNPIEELAEKLTNVKLQQVRDFVRRLDMNLKHLTKPDTMCSIESIFHIMKESDMDFSRSTLIIETLESMASFWSIAGVMNPQMVARHVSAVSNLGHVLSILFPDVCKNGTSHEEHKKKLIMYYVVYVKGFWEENKHTGTKTLKDEEINFWCLHPAIGLKKVFESTSINGPRSMIVTSGTLEPMRCIQKELEADFKIQKSFGHVINDKQLKMLLVAESFNKYELNSDFKSAQKQKYPEELGKTLLPLIKILPFGTLIFFPSYPLMNRIMRSWKEMNIWKDMRDNSSIYIEQNDRDQFMSDVNAYKSITSSAELGPKSKAIFFCVCRGKLSEGINLEGNQCRTVIVIGLPFPNMVDPRINSTRKFHDSRGNRYWYSEQMRRALNQTIGRVIRSRTDFGMLLLIDPRFQNFKYSLSEWTREFYPTKPVIMSHIEREIKGFFHQHGIDIKQSASQNVGAFEIACDINFDNLSPFSEEGESENHNSVPKVDQPNLAQQKQNALVAQYRAAREQQRSQPVEERDGPVTSTPKRQKTTLDAFNSIYSQNQNISSAPINLSALVSAPSRDIQPVSSVSNAQFAPSHRSIQSPTNHSPDLTPITIQIAPASQILASARSIQPTTQSSVTTQSTNASSLNYSITNQVSDKDRPTTYTCCLCKNIAIRPHSTMCLCDRIGCQKCLLRLAGRKCHKCGTMLRKRDFKPRLFKSAYRQDERTPVIVINQRDQSARASQNSARPSAAASRVNIDGP